ncbi:MAG: hypothetical protein Ct9H300mP6_04020 [Gammaproteobacteria bacterium]|nr:MAG: hypothetical protein Ct9H300mP6_04020 [Gammaproteobacteria bacterium]
MTSLQTLVRRPGEAEKPIKKPFYKNKLMKEFSAAVIVGTKNFKFYTNEPVEIWK